MDGDTLLFFQKDMQSLPLYERFEHKVVSELPDVTIKVQKSQISFYNRHLFACVSFMQIRRAKDRPAHFIVVSFGLDHPLESPRIDGSVMPYPGRWTHHVLISSPEEIDDELMGWVREASLFSAAK